MSGAGSSDREGVVKDKAGPVNSGQAPPLPSQGQLLPVGAPPSWLVPRGRGEVRAQGGRADGDLEMGGGDARMLMPFLPISQPLTCHCRDPQGSLFSFPSMPASTSVPPGKEVVVAKAPERTVPA